MKNFFLLFIVTLLSFNITFSAPIRNSASSNGIQLVTNLYVITASGSPVLLDGTLTMYSTDYSNSLDRYDARKMTNPGENWGMLRNNKVYIVERRHIIEGSDSVFFKMWNMRSFNYRLEIIATNLNFPGRTAVLEDNYLHTSTSLDLSGNTEIDFSVDGKVAASQAADRFRLIISNSKPAGLVPVAFIFSNAVRNNQTVDVSWQAENISDANVFSIQKSADGIHFQNTSEVKVNPLISQYNFTDQNPQEGTNYYRIASPDKNGKVQYSKTMKVNVVNELENISIYPNPATAENLNLKMSNLASGEYTVRLLNSFGQAFLNRKFQYSGGTVIEKIQPSQKVPAGIYRVEVISHDGKRKTMSIVF